MCPGSTPLVTLAPIKVCAVISKAPTFQFAVSGVVYCEVCGFYPLDEKFKDIYPNLNQQNYLSMFDVHHIKGIKEGERFTDPINDSMVVCGNCHELADQS